MDIRQLVLTTSLVACGLFAAPSWANLIVNGGFEDPLVTNSGPPPGLGFDYLSGNQIPGWTITSNHEPLFNTSYNPVGGGSQALQLESLSPVLQSFGTSAGQLYQLSFDLAAYNMNDVAVQIAPLEIIVDGLTANLVGTDAAYVTHTLLFTATGPSTTLSFRNAGAFGVNFPQIDDVSVVAVGAVPEPGSLALLGVSLAAFAFGWGRRKA